MAGKESDTAPKRAFEWTGKGGQSLTLAIPSRIKRGKVARMLAANNMFGAFDLIFTPEEVAALEDVEFSPEEWDDFTDQLWTAITGADPKS